MNDFFLDFSFLYKFLSVLLRVTTGLFRCRSDFARRFISLLCVLFINYYYYYYYYYY